MCMVYITFLFLQAQKNFLIPELITWKDYTLQIAAYNEKGVGVFSDGIKIKTKEGSKLNATQHMQTSFTI